MKDKKWDTSFYHKDLTELSEALGNPTTVTRCQDERDVKVTDVLAIKDLPEIGRCAVVRKYYACTSNLTVHQDCLVVCREMADASGRLYWSEVQIHNGWAMKLLVKLLLANKESAPTKDGE